MNDVVRQFRDFFVSLKLTVALLALGMVLVFAATLDQTNLGIWGIQEKWFRSFIVLQDIRGIPVPVFPGGYFIGGLLLINLISAHVYRFKLNWRKAGIFLVHVGLILLLLGELFTGILQEDYQMRMTQDEPMNYSEHTRKNELAIIETTSPEFDDVVAIPEPVLAKGGTLTNEKLPFRVVVKEYYPNSSVRDRAPAGAPMAASEPPPQTDKGVASQVVMTPLRMTYKQDERNWPSAYVELVGNDGASLGTWLLSAHPGIEFSGIRDERRPEQTLEVGGRKFTIAMRPTRHYKPYTLTLLKFSHDRYAGTDIPKNFSSNIRLTTPDGSENREVLIYMNNPLRYAGLTFYQASYDPNNPKVSVLQVVRNPSWLVPYIACILMSVGLVVQFMIHLGAFLGKRRTAPVTATA
jgi:hypothetical protein